MATKLKNLVITKVALVDEGSCSAAHIKLYKRKEGGKTIMTFEELMKSLPEDQQAIVKKAMEDQTGKCPICGKTEGCTCKADMDAKAQENSALQKEKENLTAELNKSKKTDDEEELMKNASPEVRAILEKMRSKAQAAEAAILKMKDESDEAEALAKAKELPNIGADEATLAKSLKGLKNTDEDLFKDVFGILKAANALIATENPLGEIGKSVNADNAVELQKASDAAWTEIEKAAKEIQKSSNTTKEVAIAKAIQDNPKLYQDYLKNLQ